MIEMDRGHVAPNYYPRDGGSYGYMQDLTWDKAHVEIELDDGGSYYTFSKEQFMKIRDEIDLALKEMA